MSLTDSEEDSDSGETNDPCNESLEPTFKKEDINRSRLLRQSLANACAATDNISEGSLSDDSNDRTAERINDTVTFEKSDDTLLDDDGFDDGEEREAPVNDVERNTSRAVHEMDHEVAVDHVDKDTATFEDNDDEFDANDVDVRAASETVISSSDAVEEKCVSQMIARGTYFVRRSQDDSTSDRSSVVPESDTSRDAKDVKEEIQESGIGEDDEITKESRKLEHETKTDVNTPLTIRDTLVNKIIKSLKSTSEAHNSNASLAQFEQLELAASEMDAQAVERKSEDLLKIEVVKDKKTYFDDNLTDESKEISDVVTSNEPSKEKRVYFDNLDTVVESDSNRRISDVKNLGNLKCDQFRSPSIVKEDTGSGNEPSTMKLFGESFTRQPDPITSINKINLLKKKNDSVDVFECFDSPRNEAIQNDKAQVEDIRKSVGKIDLNDKHDEVVANIDKEFKKPVVKEPAVNMVMLEEKSRVNEECGEKVTTSEPTDDSSRLEAELKVDNTLEEFEKIYKDVSQARPTDFEMLVTDTINASNVNGESEIAKTQDTVDTKYNLRKKTLKKSESEGSESRNMPDCKKAIDENYVIEVLKESQAKCESAARTKRNLRLRRRRQQDSESTERDKGAKLKDIVNLQTEFSDVTMDVPAPKREVKDIASPVKADEAENVPPMQEIQSCPSKR